MQVTRTYYKSAGWVQPTSRVGPAAVRCQEGGEVFVLYKEPIFEQLRQKYRHKKHFRPWR